MIGETLSNYENQILGEKEMSRSKKIKIIITIVCISFIQGLQFCVSPVLGQIQEHYPDASVSMVQMLVTAPTFLSIVVAIISGGLVVKISKKKMLIFGDLEKILIRY